MIRLHPVESLPVTPLPAAPPRREAAPLEPTIRGFMEGRFDADFGDVRIHAGPESVALCRALGARALTLGRDILFGAGQYAPACPAGRRLLAHELVHVLQQRAAGPRAMPGLAAVGHPLDPCEREADRLADEALSRGLRSAVTPDVAGVLRLAPLLVEPSARLVIDAAGAKPGVDLTLRKDVATAVLHLTRNKEPIVKGKTFLTKADFLAAAAVNITGTVFVAASSKAEIDSKWEFHLIQLLHPVVDSASFAGRKPADGSMELNFAAPPGKKGGFFLDSDPGFRPYCESWPAQATQFQPGAWQVKVELADHPFTDVALMLPNLAAKDATNYLYSTTKHCIFVTSVVALDRAKGDYKILCHLQWGYKGVTSYRWTDRGGDEISAKFSMDVSTFNAGTTTLGDPVEKGVADLIKKPSKDPSDLYNKVRPSAYAAAILGTSSSNFKGEANWSPSVPRDLFK
jgi:hypothetical protein